MGPKLSLEIAQGDAISEILNGFFSFLDSQSLASCNLVCKQWCNLTDHKPINDPLWNQAIAREIHQYASFIFGKEEWTKYFGDIGDTPNYPRDICKILASNCPFFKGQTVGKTHMFVLVPEKVNGEPLTLNLLGQLVKKPKEGIKTRYDEYRCWETVFKILEPLLENAKMKKCQVFFVDGAHLIHGINPSVVWSEKRLFIKANSGRQRLNILGALNVVSHEMLYESNDSVVNAWTSVNLLRKIREAYPEGPISIVLDNACYQKCYVAQRAAYMMKIELVYLPAYSPNLNLIERSWKFLRKKCMNSKYYITYSEHCNSIKSCIDNFSTKFKEELDSLLTWNFQVFKNQPLMPT